MHIISMFDDLNMWFDFMNSTPLPEKKKLEIIQVIKAKKIGSLREGVLY